MEWCTALQVAALILSVKFWNDKAQRDVEGWKINLRKQFGFLADPSKMIWETVKEYFGNMDMRTYLVG